jgi:hypothetical protein
MALLFRSRQMEIQHKGTFTFVQSWRPVLYLEPGLSQLPCLSGPTTPHEHHLLHASPQGTARNENETLFREGLVSKDSSPSRSQARAVMVIVFN